MQIQMKQPGATESMLLEAIEASDGTRASEVFREQASRGVPSWEIHLVLYPIAQRVLNPPFINPHLPKMHGIIRELVPHLSEDKISDLVSLEIREYARRPKMEKIPRAEPSPSRVEFKEIEAAIRENDTEKTALLMATFLKQRGGAEFARRLLLLGSGYLESSLGHSVSCTAFIVLEMTRRTDMDPWPALSTLASYFCEGQFHTTPPLRKPPFFEDPKAADPHMLRATSGTGLVNLHHTITRYAIEQAREFLSQEEYNHIVHAWIDFLGDKGEDATTLDGISSRPLADYDRFYEEFSALEAKPVALTLRQMIGSEEGRDKAAGFLVRAVCDKYQGSYNPHYLTGLGSALWVLKQYGQDPLLVTKALLQYLDFFFKGIKA